MITFIVIIIVYIIGKFLYDSAKQSNQMKAQGGVRTKYSELIELLKGDQGRIFQQTNTFVAVGVSGIAGSQIFYIQQTFGKVTIQMKVQNNPLFGNVKMEWAFPESMNQEHMVIKIMNDIQAKTQSLIQRYQ